MQKYHPYSVEYTIGGIPHGNSFIFALNRQEALTQAKKDLEDDGMVYDEGSLEVKREYCLYYEQI
jgi:hypothetical protein